ncbi:kinase-like domain, phloem protein 2-like protein [Tanacetum coccineum]
MNQNRTVFDIDEETDAFYLQKAVEYHEWLIQQEAQPRLTRTPIFRDREDAERRLRADYFDDHFNHDDFAHLKILLESILSATNNFDDRRAIFTSEFEKRYWGQLLWSGELIMIHARRWLNKERDDEKEQLFWMEISMLSSLKHKNVVSLVGFCDENDEKIIIVKQDETKGSLSHYLSYPMLLTWVKRLEICVGVAHALSYIHYDEHGRRPLLPPPHPIIHPLPTPPWPPQPPILPPITIPPTHRPTPPPLLHSIHEYALRKMMTG